MINAKKWVNFNILQFAFHSACIVVYTYAVHYLVNYVRIPGNDKPPRNYAGQWKFLTFWDAVLQMIFYVICSIADVTRSQRIDRIKDLFFAIIIFPLSMFVCFTFWGLYLIDRNLVFPIILDKFFPLWLNHVVHTLICISTLIELYLHSHNYPTRTKGVFFLLLGASIYIYWSLHIAYFAGFWVYPFLDKLNLIQRTIFYLFALLLLIILYVVGEKFNSILSVKQVEKKVKSKQKQKKSKRND